jgi:hypothetical protein
LNFGYDIPYPFVWIEVENSVYCTGKNDLPIFGGGKVENQKKNKVTYSMSVLKVVYKDPFLGL